jgi:GTP-sensing pleiotropic transcriptional regulator CodY
MQNLIEKYQTVGTILKSNRKNTTLSVQFQNVIEKYQTLGTIQKYNRKKYHTVGKIPKSI